MLAPWILYNTPSAALRCQTRESSVHRRVSTVPYDGNWRICRIVSLLNTFTRRNIFNTSCNCTPSFCICNLPRCCCFCPIMLFKTQPKRLICLSWLPRGLGSSLSFSPEIHRLTSGRKDCMKVVRRTGQVAHFNNHKIFWNVLIDSFFR